MAILVSGDFCAFLDAPMGEAYAIADAGVKGAIVAQGKDGRRGGGGAVVPEKRESKAIIARVLVREKAEDDAWLAHEVSKSGGIESAFKVSAAGAIAEGLEETVKGGLAEAAISGSALVGRGELAKAGVEFEVAKVADGTDDGTGGR